LQYENSDSNSCEIFFEQLDVDMSDPEIDLHVPVMIIVGTKPLQSVLHQPEYEAKYGVPAAVSIMPGSDSSASSSGRAILMANLRK
jgi:hypothetical protein